MNNIKEQMKKVVKQIAVNIFLVLFSVLVIFIANSIKIGRIDFELKAYLGSDIVFVMITSLATMAGWRFSERIVAHWIYDLVFVGVLLLFVFEYGISVAENAANKILIDFIYVSCFVFLAVYAVENIIVIHYFRKTCKGNRQSDGVGY